MRTLDPGNPSQSARSAWASAGFTLIELLVVIAIVAVASAGVGFAMRDAGQVQLAREADRLAALLESARAADLPQKWLDADTTTALQPGESRNNGLPLLVLGPDPIIGPQSVVLTSRSAPEQRVRLATDGVRPFAVQPDPL